MTTTAIDVESVADPLVTRCRGAASHRCTQHGRCPERGRADWTARLRTSPGDRGLQRGSVGPSNRFRRGVSVMAKTKTLGANLAVPQSREDAARMVREIGDLTRRKDRLEADMNDELTRIKELFE